MEAELDAEDDSDSLAVQVAAIEAAREELERVTAILMVAQDHFSRMTETMSLIRPLSESRIPMARQFLMNKVGLLRSYQAVRLDLDGSPDTPLATARNDVTTPGLGLSSWEDITQVALPGGFVWVRLDEIALDEELIHVRDASDFSKVAYDEMKIGAQRFVDHVLPLVHQDKSVATSEYFAELDRKGSVPFADGMQRVFDAFLGRWSPIYLCRGSEGGKYTISNGRHRIKIASDLGWLAVPAQVKDVRNHARNV
jgi:hypothetical protein